MSAAAPAVLKYLMGTTFPTALASFTDPNLGSGVTIYFGPGVKRFNTPITLQLHGVQFDMEWAEVGPNYRYEERGTLPCTLTSWVAGDSSSEGFLDRMTECFSALSLITINIANDVRLGGLVRLVRLKMGQLQPGSPGDSGSMAHLDFHLHYEVRVDSLTATGQDP